MRLGRSNRSKPFIGIYISSAHVKLLELVSGRTSTYVASYAAEPLPTNAVSEHQIINAEAVGQAISNAIKKARTRNRNAAIGVAGAAVISKIISMPNGMTDEDIEQQILTDAPQHIPYPIENVSLDFQIRGPDPENPDFNQILLVACRRDNVDMRTAVLETAKLKPQVVDVEEFALRNACSLLHGQMPNKGHGTTVAVFDMGSEQTYLNIQSDRQTVYSQDIPFGGQSLAEELVNLQGLNDTDQLSTRLRNGQIKALDISLPLSTFCDQAAQQVESTLEFYFSTEAESDDIDQVLITGSCSLYPEFEEQMEQRLPWPVACANPLRGFSVSRQASHNNVEYDGPALMTAAGLSMRAFV